MVILVFRFRRKNDCCFFIGYVTQELTVNQNQSNLTIQLKDDSKQLNEVVVIGYGTVEKKDLTGSIQSVTSKELSNW